MTDLIHDEEAKIVYAEDRPVRVTLQDGREMYMKLGDLVADAFESEGRYSPAVVTINPDEEHSNFVENND